MAQAIGLVKSVEKGTFYLKDPKGYMIQLRAGDTINEGDLVYGSPINMADAKIVIDVTLAGAGDLVIAHNGALTFESSVLAGMFNGQNAVAYVDSMQETLAVAEATTEIKTDIPPVDVTDQTAAGDETAAGEEVTNTEYLGDVFSSPNGMITDVTTDLRSTSSNITQNTINRSQEMLVEETPQEPTPPPPPPPPPAEANAPILEVELGEGKIINSLYSNENVYNLHEHNNTTGNLFFNGSAKSMTISLKSYKTGVDDGQILLKDQNGEVIQTINIDTLFNDNDPHNQPVDISFDTPFYGLEVLNFVSPEDTNSEFKIDGISADLVSYQYPLNIVTASGEDLSDINVIGFDGLPEGAILSNGADAYILDSDTFTFSSEDSDVPASWTLTVPNELSEDVSIVASLTSTDLETDTSATAYVGVFGDNEIVGTDGNDSFDGRDGSDSMYGMDGDDSFIYDAGDALIDGGAGTDTLILTGSTSIDFDNWDTGSIKNIEVIDLTEDTNSLKNISYEDVVNMTSGNNNLYILGNSGDVVDFLDNENWQIGSDTVIQNVNGIDHVFDVYTYGEDPTVVVHVEQAITDTIL